jgi:hypothetical protein
MFVYEAPPLPPENEATGATNCRSYLAARETPPKKRARCKPTVYHANTPRRPIVNEDGFGGVAPLVSHTFAAKMDVVAVDKEPDQVYGRMYGLYSPSNEPSHHGTAPTKQ